MSVYGRKRLAWKGETAEGSESGPDTFPGIQQNMLCTVTIVERYHRLRLIPE